MKLYVWFILIPVSGCSTFIGFPESSWTTSSHVCSLPKIEQINTTDVFNNSSNYMVYKNVEKAWTGTVIKHTKWAAFIGCGISLSPKDSGISVKTAEDCLKHCSDHSSATYFAIKSSICVCLTHKPALNDDINDCRIECDNAIYTPCSSGRSSLVFTFVEDVIIQPTTTYIEKECVTTTKDKNKFIVSDCNAPYIFGCKNTSIQLTAKSWYEYQELCLKDGSSVLFNRNTIGNHASEKPLWTPIFRSHIVVTGKLSVNDSCVAVSKVGTNNLTVENCASQFPFLCLGKQKKNTIDSSSSNNRYPRFITLPLGVIVAVGIFILLLLMIIIFLSCKLLLSKDTAQVKNDLSVDNTWI
ncbi:uncharacterized protein LOC143045580 isoform X2 [Mytilus galloprovincialis]|uniref:uncharacterized protein LOC143045580 isoform X2 n=1 Tax=Mytilus galloprovincialis TaxID=29158 RepID=UPI003F7B5A32